MAKLNLEALTYVGSQSPLFTGLTSLFQEVMVVKEEALTEYHEDKQKIAAAVHDFLISDDWQGRFKKLVKVETGINLTKIEIVDVLKLNFEFSTLPSFDKALIHYAKGKPNKPSGTIGSVDAQIDKLRASLENTNNKVPKDTGGLYIDTIINLPMAGGFLVDILEPSYDAFTPEELAAVYIHEFGHTLATLEYIDRVYVSMRHIKIPTPPEISNKADAVELVKNIKANITSSKKNASGGIREVLHKLESVATNFINFQDNATMNHGPGVKLYIHLVTSLWYIFNSLIIIFSVREITKNDIKATKDLYLSDSDGKHSDFKAQRSDLKYNEEIADTYATMHGGGPYLITMLEKLNRYTPTLPNKIGDYNTYTIRTDILSQQIQRLRYGPMWTMYADLFGVHPKSDRYKNVYKDLTKQLRLAGGQDEVIKDILAQMKTVETLIDATSKKDRVNYEQYLVIQRFLFKLGDARKFAMKFDKVYRNAKLYESVIANAKLLGNTNIIASANKLKLLAEV